MKGPPRLITVECRCGLVRKVRVTEELDEASARRILEEQCPVCGNTGSGRIYTITVPPPLRIVKK